MSDAHDPHDQPWYEIVSIPALLRHARTAYGKAMRRALEAAECEDVPANGMWVIGGLAMGDETTALSDLIRDLRLSKQAAGQLVDALVLRGYIERTVDPGDRRRLNVALTERGRAAAAAQAGARERVDAELLEVVGQADISAMRRGLAVLADFARRPAEEAVG